MGGAGALFSSVIARLNERIGGQAASATPVACSCMSPECEVP